MCHLATRFELADFYGVRAVRHNHVMLAIVIWVAAAACPNSLNGAVVTEPLQSTAQRANAADICPADNLSHVGLIAALGEGYRRNLGKCQRVGRTIEHVHKVVLYAAMTARHSYPPVSVHHEHLALITLADYLAVAARYFLRQPVGILTAATVQMLPRYGFDFGNAEAAQRRVIHC